MLIMKNAHALVVGIANYQNLNKLPKSVLNDTKDICSLLIDPTYCGYLKENVKCLLDNQATKKGLTEALTDLAQRTKAESTVFLYISAHGKQVKFSSGTKEYLLPVDADIKTEESTAKTAISGEEFNQALSAIPAKKVIVIFDCCHSGGIGQPKTPNTIVIKDGLPNSYYDTLSQGRVILASCRDTESSWILPGANNSLFTQHLLEGLRSGVRSDDAYIRIFNLFEYLQPKVVTEKPEQHPVFKAEVEENFPIAAFRGGHIPVLEEDFLYDAYISYVDEGQDATWVWDKLVPQLEGTGLHIAVSGDVEAPGVARVIGIERGIRQSIRTVVVLSEIYLADNMAEFENVLVQTMDIQEGSYRLLPIKISDIEKNKLPTRLSMLTTLNLIHPSRSEREFERLVKALQDPLPRK